MSSGVNANQQKCPRKRLFSCLQQKKSSDVTCDPEKLERQGFKDNSMDIQDREKIKVSAET